MGGYLYNQVGILKSITYTIPQESPWEIGLSDGLKSDSNVKELPHIITVTGFEFTPIQDFVPRVSDPRGQYDTRFISLANGVGVDKTNYKKSKVKPNLEPPTKDRYINKFKSEPNTITFGRGEALKTKDDDDGFLDKAYDLVTDVGENVVGAVSYGAKAVGDGAVYVGEQTVAGVKYVGGKAYDAGEFFVDETVELVKDTKTAWIKSDLNQDLYAAKVKATNAIRKKKNEFVKDARITAGQIKNKVSNLVSNIRFKNPFK